MQLGQNLGPGSTKNKRSETLLSYLHYSSVISGGRTKYVEDCHFSTAFRNASIATSAAAAAADQMNFLDFIIIRQYPLLSTDPDKMSCPLTSQSFGPNNSASSPIHKRTQGISVGFCSFAVKRSGIKLSIRRPVPTTLFIALGNTICSLGDHLFPRNMGNKKGSSIFHRLHSSANY
jgi:hypothetical protein